MGSSAKYANSTIDSSIDIFSPFMPPQRKSECACFHGVHQGKGWFSMRSRVSLSKKKPDEKYAAAAREPQA